MNALIDEIYRTRTVTAKDGRTFELHSEVDPREGALLHRIVADDSSVVRTLEVGAGFGLSALFICEALKGRPGAQHLMIDPLQQQLWGGAAVANLERAGFNFFRLFEQNSEIVLPKMLQDGEPPFDLIFIDGSHFFDQTMVDCFYATKLLRSGGYLVIDDIQMEPVRVVLDYLLKFPCYETFGAIEWDKGGRPALRALAKAALAPFPRGTLARYLSSSLLQRTFENRQIGMMALRKTGEDQRYMEWPRWFHII